MKKANIEQMLDEINNKYLEEALDGGGVKQRYKKKNVQVAAAVLIVLLVGSSVTFAAAKNTRLRKWISSFVMQEKDVQGNKGVTIKNTEKKVKETKDDSVYYLTLESIPKRFVHDKDATELYRVKSSDTAYFTVAYFHLQSEFTNILPNGHAIEKYESGQKLAYIATSKWEHRIWIQFTGTNYMAEIRDVNKQLTREEITALIDGASVSKEKSRDNFDILEWTEELNTSYNEWLEQNKFNVQG